MPQIVKRVWICAPGDSIWAVLANFGHAEHWAPTVKECRCPTGIRSGVGAQRILTTTTGAVSEEVIVEWNEGHDFTFQIPKGLVSIAILQETWLVDRWPQGAEVIVTMVYQTKAGIIHALVEALVMRRVLTGILVKNLAGLKHHIETGERITQMVRLPISAVS